MIIFPAIDLIDGKVVRLIKGDYNQMTVYSESPGKVAESFFKAGARHLHIVDLQGAKNGVAGNFETIRGIIKESGLNVQVGGGIRSRQDVEKYVEAGAQRVILGTAAVADPEFLQKSVREYGDKIAVGVDIKDGRVAIKGWMETAGYTCVEFCERLADVGVKTVICTDISKDGMLSGTNTELYKMLSDKFSMNFIASGGVSALADIEELKAIGLYGAILGKAIYEGAITLSEALRAAGNTAAGSAAVDESREE